jgi:pimeloyl-ACP methyl ester carboxylesterase
MVAEDLQLRVAVLCAPFTTMTGMARRVVGWPLCHLNLHRFDNVARLRSLDARGASVRVFHGSDDEVIPVAMGRELHALFPRTISFTEVPDSRHNDIIMRARDDLGDAMGELSGMR